MRLAPDEEKIFASDLSTKMTQSRVDNYQNNFLNEQKMYTDFSPKTMYYKYMKRCSTLLAIRKMQIKTMV